MEQFEQHCTDIRPNITYVAIGAAYSKVGGPQQHPPFLNRFMTENPNFNIQIVIVDPLTENPPEIIQYFPVLHIDKDWYGTDNLNIHVIRKNFDFEIFKKETSNILINNISRKFLFSLINRTIAAKHENPNNTYLLFVHDFSGNAIDMLSDYLGEIYSRLDNSTVQIYKRNILIDLNNKINSGCFVDMYSIYFTPLLFKNSYGALEIFNPFCLHNDELATMLLYKYNNRNIQRLVCHAITHRINKFSTDVLPCYRQVRMFYQKKIPNLPNLAYNQGILTGITLQSITLYAPTNIISHITHNLLVQLEMVMGFLSFYKKYDELLGPFISLCNKPALHDPYQIHTIYKECQKNIEKFISEIDPCQYYPLINTYCTQHMLKHGKLPLFMELLLQDKNTDVINESTITENDTSIILEL